VSNRIDYETPNPYDRPHCHYGVVRTANGVKVFLTQEAYATNTPERPRYEAQGIDEAGNHYQVTWDCYDNWLEIEDESEVCDWDDYTVTLTAAAAA
jgi:hypothetical protein